MGGPKKKKPAISAPVVAEPEKKEKPQKKLGEYVEEGPAPTIDDPELYSTGKPLPTRKELPPPSVAEAPMVEFPTDDVFKKSLPPTDKKPKKTAPKVGFQPEAPV